MSMILSIEGNIGAGKSTLMGALRLHYNDDNRVAFADEPVGVWEAVRDDEGKTLLELYYADQRAHAFEFQMLALKTRASAIASRCASLRTKLVITERDISTDKHVFAKMLRDSGVLTGTQMQVYDLWFRSVASKAYSGRDVHRLYLRTTPELAAERTAQRARPGEASIPVSYHQACHTAHETWLKGVANVEVLRDLGDRPPEEILRDAVRHVDRLLREL